jgi:broad specificity phosphatase PhoE
MGCELVLVRHGRTDWNDLGRYQGQEGPGLNTLGQRQAGIAAKELSASSAQGLYASDLPRALETAQIIGEALNLLVRTDRRLREIHQGKWQGMLFEDIQEQYPQALQRFRSDPIHNSPPGGETVGELARRFVAALDDIAGKHRDQRILIVTHKLPMAIVKCMAAAKPPREVWENIPENAQVLPFWWPLERGVMDVEGWLSLGEE